MAFDTYETSQQDGRPVRLYEFKLGRYAYGDAPEGEESLQGEAVWRYTSADRTIEAAVGGGPVVSWTPGNFSDNGISTSGSAAPTNFEVTGPAAADPAEKFRGSPPAQTMALAVYDVHFGDVAGETRVVWIGEIAEVRRPQPDTAVFIGVTLGAAFQRTGLRLSWSKGCPHMLYDQNCGLKINTFSTPTTIIGILSGTQIQVAAAFSNALYAGGMVRWETADNYEETLMIESVSGNVVTLLGLTDKLDGVVNISITRGCARTVAACLAFDPDDPARPGETTNILNYGGMPYMPEKNPFDGTPIF